MFHDGVAMSEKPILFSAPMVRAILDGTKTQTRRVVKPQWLPGAAKSFPAYELDDGRFGFANEEDVWICPYGRPGDHLWVRETFNADWCDHVIYRADSSSAKEAGYTSEPKWKPSIFMPRKHSRILLRVTDIRVERVQDVSNDDAIAEGVDPRHGPLASDTLPRETGNQNAFRALWDSINAKRGYSWKSNPWVWAVTFERVTP